MLKYSRPIVVLVGCGGTGSYLSDHLGRLFGRGGELRENHSGIILVDADTVSETNIVRQNFSYRDRNNQKGLVLQRKLLQQYSANSVDFWASFANKKLLAKLLKNAGSLPLIIISCVDNHRTRNRIMSFLKPDPDSWDGARESDWLYLDAGNNIVDGWVSAMGFYNHNGYGVDMRQQDISMREDSVDDAPTLDEGDRRGCGNPSSSPRTYIGNQTNAILLASQLRNILLYGKGYGVQAWKTPDILSDNWMSDSYENHFLAPFELTW